MLPPEALLLLATLLILKHFLADGPFQSQYQLMHKGQFLHLGGFLHAGTHAALTALCLVVCLWLFPGSHAGLSAQVWMISLVFCLELSLHYTIDWLKCAIERSGGWSELMIADNGQRQLLIKSDMFFFAFLADQMLHSLTYVAVIFIVASRY